MIEARVRDFRIDSRLQKLCGKYLVELCGSMDAYELDETDLNTCLQVRRGWVGGLWVWDGGRAVADLNTCLQVGHGWVACTSSTSTCRAV
jgi:hypothetical protein